MPGPKKMPNCGVKLGTDTTYIHTTSPRWTRCADAYLATVASQNNANDQRDVACGALTMRSRGPKLNRITVTRARATDMEASIQMPFVSALESSYAVSRG